MLYTIITLGGIVIYSMGPWPNTNLSLTACQDEKTRFLARAAEQAEKEGGLITDTGTYQIEDLQVYCDFLDHRPDLDSKYPNVQN